MIGLMALATVSPVFGQPMPTPIAASPALPSPIFEDVTRKWGIDFTHRTGPTLRYPPEEIGPGVALLDYDGDGLLDIYFVNGGEAQPDDTIRPRHPDRLLRNLGNGHFEDVTLPSGLVGEGIGNGATACDVNNDGTVDLYLSGYHESLLYLNNGDGTFTQRGEQVGLRNPGFGASSAFGDYDRDGLLDLYVCNYVNFGYRGAPRSTVVTGSRGEVLISSLTPTSFFGEPNLLFHQRGDGTFEDVTDMARVGNNERRLSRSLGVTFADLDGDGWPDILVANDVAPIAYYQNQKNGTFRDVAERRWIEDARANMGFALGDYKGNGLTDIYVTHFSLEHSELYAQTGRSGTFIPQGAMSGLTKSDTPMVGWGCSFLDTDGDGLLDLVVANGHVYPEHLTVGQTLTARIAPTPQALEVFHNRDGKVFDDVSATAVTPAIPVVGGRGLAVGDLDGDGAADVVVAVNNGPAVVLRNAARTPGRRLAVELVGTVSNRSAVGAKIEVKIPPPPSLGAGQRPVRVTRQVLAGNGYLSTDGSVLDLGLGGLVGPVTLQVTWPAGGIESFRAPTESTHVRLVEGQGEK